MNSIGESTRDSRIAAATPIFEYLKATRISHNGSATWINRDLQEEVKDDAGAKCMNLQPGLYEGTAGIAAFLFEYGHVTGNYEAGNLAAEAIQFGLNRLGDQFAKDATAQPWASMSYYSGAFGELVWAIRIADILKVDHLRQTAEQIMERMLAAPDLPTISDVMLGHGGAIPAARTLLRAGYHEFNDLIGLLADDLIERTEPQATGRSIPFIFRGKKGIPLAGLSHGASGVAFAFECAHDAIGGRRYREASNSALAYEDSIFKADTGNWPDLREDATDEDGMVAWCHGAPGIGVARSAIEMLRGEPIANHDVIQTALDTTMGMCHTFGPLIESSWTYCHGQLGNLECAEFMSHHLGHGRIPEYETWTDERVHHYGDTHGLLTGAPLWWPTLRPGYVNLSLMKGVPGAGYGLMRLLHPEAVPSMLLPASFDLSANPEWINARGEDGSQTEKLASIPVPEVIS